MNDGRKADGDRVGALRGQSPRDTQLEILAGPRPPRTKACLDPVAGFARAGQPLAEQADQKAAGRPIACATAEVQ